MRHKHRNEFFACFKRRYDYGTSEAVLYKNFPRTRKRFPWQAGGMALLFLCLCGSIARPLFFFSAAVLLLFSEAAAKKIQSAKKFKDELPFKTIPWAVSRSHFLFAYYLWYYVARYYFILYFILLCPAAVFIPALTPLALSLVLFPGLVEFFQKKPRLNPAVFIFYFLVEQAFYQIGTLVGCIRCKSFGLYRISFAYAGFVKSERSVVDRLKKALGRTVRRLKRGAEQN